MVVVFPAPFGPKKPTMPPFSTSNEMLSTATVRAYRLVRPSTLIINICHRVSGTRLYLRGRFRKGLNVNSILKGRRGGSQRFTSQRFRPI